jgi:hypothetical protein
MKEYWLDLSGSGRQPVTGTVNTAMNLISKPKEMYWKPVN